jgi:hypothetical protein
MPARVVWHSPNGFQLDTDAISFAHSINEKTNESRSNIIGTAVFCRLCCGNCWRSNSPLISAAVSAAAATPQQLVRIREPS